MKFLMRILKTIGIMWLAMKWIAFTHTHNNCITLSSPNIGSFVGSLTVFVLLFCITYYLVKDI